MIAARRVARLAFLLAAFGLALESAAVGAGSRPPVAAVAPTLTAALLAVSWLPPLSAAPQSVEQLWAGYDPRSEPLEARVVREWQEDGVTLRYVTYAIGAFRGKLCRLAAGRGTKIGNLAPRQIVTEEARGQCGSQDAEDDMVRLR